MRAEAHGGRCKRSLPHSRRPSCGSGPAQICCFTEPLLGTLHTVSCHKQGNRLYRIGPVRCPLIYYYIFPTGMTHKPRGMTISCIRLNSRVLQSS